MSDSVLITGGAGFLGAQLAQALLARGDRVTIYDNISSGLPSNLKVSNDRLEIVHGDILDLSFLLRTLRAREVNKIIHTAALVSFGPSIEKPGLTAKINIEGMINVLESARIIGIERVLDISSEEVYGEFQYEPADEDHPQDPAMPYAITKVAAEKYETFFQRFFGLDTMIVRTSWVYGVGLPRPRAPKTLIENSLNKIPTRMDYGADHRIDHTYIDDFVQGTLLAFDKKNPENRIFNISSGKAHTFAEMADMVREIIPDARIDIGPGLLKHNEAINAPQKGALDISRARTELGYIPKFDLFGGLKAYVDQLTSDGNTVNYP